MCVNPQTTDTRTFQHQFKQSHITQSCLPLRPVVSYGTFLFSIFAEAMDAKEEGK